jgi:hypothetical protein
MEVVRFEMKKVKFEFNKERENMIVKEGKSDSAKLVHGG